MSGDQPNGRPFVVGTRPITPFLPKAGPEPLFADDIWIETVRHGEAPSLLVAFTYQHRSQEDHWPMPPEADRGETLVAEISGIGVVCLRCIGHLTGRAIFEATLPRPGDEPTQLSSPPWKLFSKHRPGGASIV